MEQSERAFEGGEQIAPSGSEPRVLLEAQLLQLDVPVAELMPDEVPEQLGGLMVAIGFDGAVDLLGAVVEAAENPAVLDGHLSAFWLGQVLVEVGGQPGFDAAALHIQEEE